MSVSRTQLLSRKRDLYAALHTLERDRRDGLIDEVSYRSAVDRYEAEAAHILEQLDAMPLSGEGRPEPEGAGPTQLALALGAVGLVVAAIVFVLLAATHHRTANETVTGTAGAAIATVPPAAAQEIAQAQRVLRLHPHSVNAYLGLGNAYLNAGDLALADREYVAAMRLAPDNPGPATLHAMALGMTGRPRAAQTVLRKVEQTHPRYARAWLLDGLYAPHSRRGYSDAIRAWRHFLALQPNGPMSNSVRRWIAAAERIARGGKT